MKLIDIKGISSQIRFIFEDKSEIIAKGQMKDSGFSVDVKSLNLPHNKLQELISCVKNHDSYQLFNIHFKY